MILPSTHKDVTRQQHENLSRMIMGLINTFIIPLLLRRRSTCHEGVATKGDDDDHHLAPFNFTLLVLYSLVAPLDIIR